MTHLKKAVAVFIDSPDEARANHEVQTVFREFAEHHKLAIVGFFAIERENVSKSIKHVVEMCGADAAQVIIVDEPRTLAIVHQELMNLLLLLSSRKGAIGFLALNLLMDATLLGALSELLRAGRLAENELRSQKIKKSLHLKKRKGMVLGGRKYGSAGQESTIVRQIKELYADGVSLQKICDLLAHHNIKTMQNKKWHPTTVKRIVERGEKVKKAAPKT